ncbi:MAG TPA: ECF transporter S component [Thermoclostridium caenicola]|uniref:ECF transporter S component n=1 Tax=Thermoclostridium caenicola TaxID=659425 RepID=A0A1M6CGK9_9FIRM|nr:ECF transporter S component [Thermoclostridium caenicola]SHI60147.1 Protein of unknown function [Thermoclostridium caenicola]HOK44111.1 ECF transporter S component [Thermoclostridium caenicola]HOL85381.1 ECF transporter S component [Thermoclostridium caenicola]HOP72041.1 ECF transporter S component [Thermoclostridium caenicola]HPO78034.1 ECF transporter S component [Thermoclostridium caenicola]
MKNYAVRKLTLSGLFLALGLLLPFLTGQIPTIGRMLLPMHIPVLLAGFVCGWPYGLIVGLICPVLRSVLFGMPPMMSALAMTFELAAYGFAAGFLYRILPKKNIFVYVALLASMLFGRIVWAGASLVIYRLSGSAFTWEMFAAGAFVNAIPGIILQIVLIPAIVMALKKSGHIEEAKAA